MKTHLFETKINNKIIRLSKDKTKFQIIENEEVVYEHCDWDIIVKRANNVKNSEKKIKNQINLFR